MQQVNLHGLEPYAEAWRPRRLGAEASLLPGPVVVPDDVDLELRLARFEQLISRRPLLLNSVLLRQNPHHVHEWHKRVALHQGRPREVRGGPIPTSLGCRPVGPDPA